MVTLPANVCKLNRLLQDQDSMLEIATMLAVFNFFVGIQMELLLLIMVSRTFVLLPERVMLVATIVVIISNWNLVARLQLQTNNGKLTMQLTHSQVEVLLALEHQ